MNLMTRPLVCRDAVELMSDYLDGALSRRERRRLSRHLVDCADCATYLEQLRAVIAASGTARPDDLAPAAVDAFVELFRRVRGDADAG